MEKMLEFHVILFWISLKCQLLSGLYLKHQMFKYYNHRKLSVCGYSFAVFTDGFVWKFDAPIWQMARLLSLNVELAGFAPREGVRT